MKNLRILKKLSKRAAPLLPMLGDTRQQFPAVTDDNYVGVPISDRKCWDRSPCHRTYVGQDDDVIFTTRRGRSMVMRNPWHPRKGTIMVGEMSGYYEPEWSEESAYEALLTLVTTDFTDFETMKAARRLRTPADVFRGAAEMVVAASANRRPE